MNTATLPAFPNMLANLQAERVRMGQWAFAAAVRMSDQNRPIGLKLIIECMFMFQALVRYVRGSAASVQRTTRRAPAVRPVRRAAVAAVSAAPTGSTQRTGATRRQPRRLVREKGLLSVTRASLGRLNRACVQQKSRFLCKVGLDR